MVTNLPMVRCMRNDGLCTKEILTNFFVLCLLFLQVITISTLCVNQSITGIVIGKLMKLLCINYAIVIIDFAPSTLQNIVADECSVQVRKQLQIVGKKCQNILTGRKLNESHKIFTFHAGQQLRLPGPCQYSISEP